jgi:peptidoglycan hydrolase-like protein with peptidoglycan-binding domain
MNPLFAVAALGGLAALVFASDSSSSQKEPKRQPAGPPPPKEPIQTLNEDDKQKVITQGYHPIITGEDASWAPTVDNTMAAQKCLQALGYDIGAVKPDGKIGPKTKAALLAFQKKYELKQTGTLTKETADLVCGADKVKVGSSQGRYAGQQDKQAGRPAATDYAARALQAGVDSSDTSIVAAFKDGYVTGYAEADVGYKAPVSDTTAASAASKGYDAGLANGASGNGIDASDSFDASGLAGEYPAYKQGYVSGYAKGENKAKADASAAGKRDALAYAKQNTLAYSGSIAAAYDDGYASGKAGMLSTAKQGKADGAAAGAKDVATLGAGSTNAMKVRDATWTALGWGPEWRPIYIANYDTAYHETPGVDMNPGIGSSAEGVAGYKYQGGYHDGEFDAQNGKPPKDFEGSIWYTQDYKSGYAAGYKAVGGTVAGAALPLRAAYDGYGNVVTRRIDLSDLYPKKLAYGPDGQPYLQATRVSGANVGAPQMMLSQGASAMNVARANMRQGPSTASPRQMLLRVPSATACVEAFKWFNEHMAGTFGFAIRGDEPEPVLQKMAAYLQERADASSVGSGGILQQIAECLRAVANGNVTLPHKPRIGGYDSGKAGSAPGGAARTGPRIGGNVCVLDPSGYQLPDDGWASLGAARPDLLDFVNKAVAARDGGLMYSISQYLKDSCQGRAAQEVSNAGARMPGWPDLSRTPPHQAAPPPSPPPKSPSMGGSAMSFFRAR